VPEVFGRHELWMLEGIWQKNKPTKVERKGRIFGFSIAE